MHIIIMTSDKRNWLLKGFMHQWIKYCPVKATILGFTKPSFPLHPLFDFHSAGKFEDYPADKWSNALIEYLAGPALDEKYVAIFLEDYWLIRDVPGVIFRLAESWMNQFPKGFRFDLTSDRLYCGTVIESGCVGTFDLITASNQEEYAMSLQAGVFNRELLLQILKRDKSPWDVESEGSGFLKQHPEWLVFGTRQWPVRYQIMVRAGEFTKSGDWMVPPRQLSISDWNELERLGFTEKP